MNTPMPRAGTGKMQSIEGARGIAALMVVFMHCAHLMRVPAFTGHVGLGGIFDFGYVGVDFFFVLSGFIITYVHFADIGKPARLGSYLWRRLTRIYPIYWICVALYIVVQLAGRIFLGKAAPFELGVNDILPTVFLVRTDTPTAIGVAWSLQYEIMFYFAFCVLLFHKRGGLVALLLWSLGCVSQLNLSGIGDPSIGLFSASSLQFLMGVGIGWIARTPRDIRPFKGALACAVLAFAAGVWLECSVLPAHSDLGRLALGAASAGVLWILVELEKHGRIQTPHWLARIGSVSYSVYLTHVLFINLSYSVLVHLGIYHALPEWLVFAIGFAGGLATSACLGFFIELPLVARLKDLYGRAGKDPAHKEA